MASFVLNLKHEKKQRFKKLLIQAFSSQNTDSRVIGSSPHPQPGLIFILDALILADQLLTAVISMLGQCACPGTLIILLPHPHTSLPSASLVKAFISETSFDHIFFRGFWLVGPPRNSYASFPWHYVEGPPFTLPQLPTLCLPVAFLDRKLSLLYL